MLKVTEFKFNSNHHPKFRSSLSIGSRLNGPNVVLWQFSKFVGLTPNSPLFTERPNFPRIASWFLFIPLIFISLNLPKVVVWHIFNFVLCVCVRVCMCVCATQDSHFSLVCKFFENRFSARFSDVSQAPDWEQNECSEWGPLTTWNFQKCGFDPKFTNFLWLSKFCENSHSNLMSFLAMGKKLNRSNHAVWQIPKFVFMSPNSFSFLECLNFSTSPPQWATDWMGATWFFDTSTNLCFWPKILSFFLSGPQIYRISPPSFSASSLNREQMEWPQRSL